MLSRWTGTQPRTGSGHTAGRSEAGVLCASPRSCFELTGAKLTISSQRFNFFLQTRPRRSGTMSVAPTRSPRGWRPLGRSGAQFAAPSEAGQVFSLRSFHSHFTFTQKCFPKSSPSFRTGRGFRQLSEIVIRWERQSAGPRPPRACAVPAQSQGGDDFRTVMATWGELCPSSRGLSYRISIYWKEYFQKSVRV